MKHLKEMTNEELKAYLDKAHRMMTAKDTDAYSKWWWAQEHCSASEVLCGRAMAKYLASKQE